MVSLTQLKSDECVFVKYVNNIKGVPSLNLDNILDHGMFDTMTEVPLDQRVYPSCPHPIASMILMMYVDNNLVRTNCDELVEEFETKVREHGRMNLNRDGNCRWFLGVRYSFDKVSGAVSADQEAYIDTLLDNYGLTDCNPCQLPIRPDVDLANIPLPSSPDNVRAYAMLIDELMYVAVNTVPTIAYAVICLARYMTKATPQHCEYVRQVLRYLKGVKHRKLNWYSYFLFCNNAAFSWKCALARILALSTSEAELIAACACAQEVLFCRKLANELGFLQIAPTLLFEDNHGAICLTQHGHFKGRNKHLHLRWKFIKDCIDNDVLKLVPIASENMIADIGTAARPAPALKIASAAIYGDLALHQSVTLPIQPNTLGKRKR